MAARELVALGYTNVKDYKAGKQDWIDAGLPVRRVWLAICEEFEVPPKLR